MTETNEQNIFLSEQAAAKALQLAGADTQNTGLSLRLYIEGKGCDGFFYGVSFDQATPEDLHFPNQGVDLIVDPDTIEFVQGSTIDWVDDERGQGFLVANPNHRKFRGKFFKRSAWQQHFLDKAKMREQDQHEPG